ncbi:hypothetical protein [Paraburkholderia youngii]|uniref:hypothetical protein n=1 Tax=Paraburkholderia youngii TaxID=2782701 RepID=UPI003D1C46E9
MNKQANEAAKRADVVLMADAYVAATKTVQLLNADGLAAVFTAQVVEAMSRGLAVFHSERAPSDDEVALAKAIKDIREAGGNGKPYWPAALEWNPHFGRAWEAAIRNCSEIQPDKGDALRRAIAQSRMDDVQEARNLPDIFEIEAAMDKVRARDALPLYSPEPLWWNDPEINCALYAGDSAGYLSRISTTQVQWKEAGIDALKAAHAASSILLEIEQLERLLSQRGLKAVAVPGSMPGETAAIESLKGGEQHAAETLLEEVAAAAQLWALLLDLKDGAISADAFDTFGGNACREVVRRKLQDAEVCVDAATAAHLVNRGLIRHAGDPSAKNYRVVEPRTLADIDLAIGEFNKGRTQADLYGQYRTYKSACRLERRVPLAYGVWLGGQRHVITDAAAVRRAAADLLAEFSNVSEVEFHFEHGQFAVNSVTFVDSPPEDQRVESWRIYIEGVADELLCEISLKSTIWQSALGGVGSTVTLVRKDGTGEIDITIKAGSNDDDHASQTHS